MAECNSTSESAAQERLGHEHELRLEEPTVRVLAFLANVQPTVGCLFSDENEAGRRLITGAAIALRTGDEIEWDAEDCANVVSFLSAVAPIEGSCFCNDTVAEDENRPDLTCGFRDVLDTLKAQILKLAGQQQAQDGANG